MPIPRASQALSRFAVLDRCADGDAAGKQPGGPRHGANFQNLHRNKRAITLNLKDPKGLEVFRRLAEKADVVVENFRPDVKARLGIDYKSLQDQSAHRL
jgi:crotonobetainyl-CoA:carnitine CoA-transferase CaiB-like acyl-CoA transferase